MENLQNTQNPQEQIKQAEAQILNVIITNAKLDVNNPQHQQAAQDVIKTMSELQAPERQKERDALMREFGLQPDEFNKAIKGFEQQLSNAEQQINSIDQQLQDFEVKGQELTDKIKKKSMVSGVVGLVAGVAAAVGIYKGYLGKEGKDFKKWKKWGGTILTGLVGSKIVGKIVGAFTAKPAMREAEQLGLDAQQAVSKREEVMAQGGQIEAKAQEYQYDTSVELASRMLKSRVEAANKAAEEKVEQAQDVSVEQVKEPVEEKFTDKVVAASKGNAKDEVLAQEGSKISPDAIVEQKEAAANATHQVC